MLTKPIGNKLDSIVVDQFRVVKEGNGQTLGLTSTMRNFSADVGPYIGMIIVIGLVVEKSPLSMMFPIFFLGGKNAELQKNAEQS